MSHAEIHGISAIQALVLAIDNSEAYDCHGAGRWTAGRLTGDHMATITAIRAVVLVVRLQCHVKSQQAASSRGEPASPAKGCDNR